MTNEEAYNRFNFNIMTPIYRLIKAYIEENFDKEHELTKELEGMKLAKKSLGQYGTEFEKSALDQYIWELESKLGRLKSQKGRD